MMGRFARVPLPPSLEGVTSILKLYAEEKRGPKAEGTHVAAVEVLDQGDGPVRPGAVAAFFRRRDFDSMK